VRRLLILGGTAEGAALARAASGLPGWSVESSLAGRTRAPAALPGEVRVGGFGGPEGLARHLEEAGIDAVVDATHPFAARISANAEAACRLRPTPRLALVRPAWEPGPGDRWTEVAGMEAAVAAIPPGARVFLTVGRQEVGAFAARGDAWFLVRLVDPPDAPLPLARAEVVLGRGPFDREAERALMADRRVDLVVAKNSGGEASRAKLLAARDLGLPAVLVRRPEPPSGPKAADVAEALDWLRGL
jgi:precorrin-6A/cobalt-precorrin-6A reductase